MITFWMISALLLLICLAFLLPPLLRSSGSREANARLDALNTALKAGVLTNAEFELKKQKLASDVNPSSKRSSALAVGLTILLPVLGVLVYFKVGEPLALDPVNIAARGEATELSAPELDAALSGLAAKLAKQPDDIQGWLLLGRGYKNVQRFDEALAAFSKARELEPENLETQIDYAEALALTQPGRRIAGPAKELLQGVLQQSPDHPRVQWLLGIAELQAGDNAKAVQIWQKLLTQLEPGSSVAQSVQAQIDSAQQAMGSDPATAPIPKSAVASVASESAPADSTQANSNQQSGITVQVSLAPELASQVSPSDTLFIFARAAQGPPMPLAVQRLTAAQLPATVKLDDSMSMMPTMKLSSFDQVIIGARISRSGVANAQKGDLQGLSAAVSSSSGEPIKIEIDQIIE